MGRGVVGWGAVSWIGGCKVGRDVGQKSGGVQYGAVQFIRWWDGVHRRVLWGVLRWGGVHRKIRWGGVTPGNVRCPQESMGFGGKKC